MPDRCNLHEIVRRVADIILSLETRSPQPAHEPVLTYVTEAVAVELRHRKRTSDLARRLAVIEAVRAGAAADGAFYRSLIADKTAVHVRCRDGHEILRAVVRDADGHALLIETADGSELLLIGAIISITSTGPRSPS